MKLFKYVLPAGSLNVVINWKETAALDPLQATSERVWSQTQSQGDKWVEQRIRIANPYRNFEVRFTVIFKTYFLILS